MRRKLLFVLFTLLGSTILTALDNPKVNQFTVCSDKGNVFSVNQNISTVFEQLGEPDSKKNMWAEYPNASCAYYNVEYDGIDFSYYDINNNVVFIDVHNKKYSICDNGIRVGSSYSKIIKEYGEPEYEKSFLNPKTNRKEIQLRYSTADSDLSYIKQTIKHYYGIIFYVDEITKKCSSFVIYWNYE